MDVNLVNSLLEPEFIYLFSNIVEKYDACALYLLGKRPFSDRAAIAAAASEFLERLPLADVEMVLTLHPDLVGRIADERNLTEESQQEQRLAGLREISDTDSRLLETLNTEYKTKFGFPFIICARENKFQSILNGLRQRVGNSKEQELIEALGQVKKIVHYRINSLVTNIN